MLTHIHTRPGRKPLKLTDSQGQWLKRAQRARELFARTHCSRCDEPLHAELDSVLDDMGHRIPTDWCGDCRGVPDAFRAVASEVQP